MQATTVFDLNTIERRCVSAPVRDRIPKTFGLDAVRDIQVLCTMNLSKHVAALTRFTTRTGNPCVARSTLTRPKALMTTSTAPSPTVFTISTHSY